MTSDQIEKIAEYLDGEMSLDEQKAFKRELVSDKELLAVYNTYRDVETYMSNTKKGPSDDAAKNTLKQLRDEFLGSSSDNNISLPENKEPLVSAEASTSKQIHQTKIFQLWKLAVAVCLAVIAIGVWYMISNTKHEEHQVVAVPNATVDSTKAHTIQPDTAFPENAPASKDIAKQTDKENKDDGKLEQLNAARQKLLFTKYFKPDTIPADKDALLADAFEAYEKKQYNNAAIDFEISEAEFSSRGIEGDKTLAKFYASYYKALSFIAVNKNDKAIEVLKHLAGPNALQQSKVQWYLALAYLQKGNAEEAVLLLRKLNEGRGEYQLIAGDIMGKLKAQ